MIVMHNLINAIQNTKGIFDFFIINTRIKNFQHQCSIASNIYLYMFYNLVVYFEDPKLRHPLFGSPYTYIYLYFQQPMNLTLLIQRIGTYFDIKKWRYGVGRLNERSNIQVIMIRSNRLKNCSS